MILDTLSGICLALGCVLSLVGGLGMHRFNDFYGRLHAVGITDTLCTFLILAGLAFQVTNALVAIKLLLIFLFLLFTSPTSSYSLAHNAWKWGLRPKGTPEEPVKSAQELNK